MLTVEQKEQIRQSFKESSNGYYQMFCKEKRHKHYQDNREKVKKQSKLYRDTHKEYYKKYRLEHKEESKSYQNNKWKTDLNYKLNKAMTYQIGFSLKGNKKGRHWENLVGYTYNDLMKRLKQTMPKGYSWENYLSGELHIDHIIPKSVFNFTTPEHSDFKKCWALSNLQLLPAKENIVKKDKLYKPFQPSLKI